MNILFISVCLGAFIGTMCWQVYQVFNEIPEENRAFLDRPAKGFQVVWPLVKALEHHCGHLYSDAQKNSVYFRLRGAGKEYSILPEQFISAKFISAAMFALGSFIFLAMLGKSAFILALAIGFGGFYYPELWLKEAAVKRKANILKRLPFYLDIITLAVEAGTNLTGGLTQAVAKSGDSALRSEFSRVLRDIRAGKTRSESLRAMADRVDTPAISGVVASMIQAEKTGSSLGAILRAQADQIRTERFQRAEKQAMEAPVKMLGPLVMFIFPCTFMVLGFLILSKAILQGLITWAPLVWVYSWPAQ